MIANIWPGETVAIFATGPGMSREVAEGLRGTVRAIAIKESLLLAPWADMLVCHDASWWEREAFAKAFQGLKVSGQAADDVEVLSGGRTCVVLGAGRVLDIASSGLLAARAAEATGVARIILCGFDGGEGHWRAGRPARAPEVAEACAVALHRFVYEMKDKGVAVEFHGRARPPAGLPASPPVDASAGSLVTLNLQLP